MRKQRSDKGVEKKPIEERKKFIQVGLLPKDWDYLRNKAAKSLGEAIENLIRNDRMIREG